MSPATWESFHLVRLHIFIPPDFVLFLCCTISIWNLYRKVVVSTDSPWIISQGDIKPSNKKTNLSFHPGKAFIADCIHEVCPSLQLDIVLFCIFQRHIGWPFWFGWIYLKMFSSQQPGSELLTAVPLGFLSETQQDILLAVVEEVSVSWFRPLTSSSSFRWAVFHIQQWGNIFCPQRHLISEWRDNSCQPKFLSICPSQSCCLVLSPPNTVAVLLFFSIKKKAF